MIAIIDYRAGNIRSVQNALQRLGKPSMVTQDPDAIRRADHVIFPGVGHATAALRNLQQTGLDRVIPTLEQPFLGICLGLQLICAHSEEGNTHGLGLFPVGVKKFQDRLPVPHMGWNSITHDQSSLFEGIPQETDFYFVHSYYAEVSAATTATTTYGLPFAAALRRANFQAVQFHPEKSGEAGMLLLQNFLQL